jgi:spore maturation protein CgeB
MSPEAKERLSNELPSVFLNEHRKKPFDIFFSYLQNLQIIPDVLKEIKKHVYTINYTTNYHQFDLYKEIAQIVDYNIYISKIAKEGFDKAGVKSYWMPLAANPDFYKRSAKKNDKSVFIGQAYGPRPYLFWRLLQYNINLEIYGSGWTKPNFTDVKPEPLMNEPLTIKSTIRKSVNKLLSRYTAYEIRAKEKQVLKTETSLEDKLRRNYSNKNEIIISLLRRDYNNHLHPSVSETDYVNILSEAGTVINIQESRFNHDYFNHNVLFGSNLRDFETTMCGSFLCTQFSEEISELFNINEDLICYYNEHDLAEKIKYYDINKDIKERIALSGYNRSINEHTWEKRFISFFNSIDI